MAEERTTQALPIEEINQLTKTLVDTMAEGTPKEIAKGLEAQFVDRSTEHLYRKGSPIDQSGSSVVYKYLFPRCWQMVRGCVSWSFQRLSGTPCRY